MSVTRYVLTCIWKDIPSAGRDFLEPRQGRYTYPDFATADAYRTVLLADGSLAARYPHAAATLEVRPVECWPGHFDPCGNVETEAEFETRFAAILEKQRSESKAG